jgi:hypothetical protein
MLILSVSPVYDNKKIWEMKIPLKNKKIAWYLREGVILTKDNLIKQNWHGSKTCVFCSQDEIIKHLFFQCNFVRSIWSVIRAASSEQLQACILLLVLPISLVISYMV